MEKFAILIVGRGKIAEELLHGLCSPAISRVVRWDERDTQEGDRYIKIAESHQALKSTKPGTAVYLAKSLGIPDERFGQKGIRRYKTRFLEFRLHFWIVMRIMR